VLALGSSLVAGVRGKGLLVGVALTEPAAAAVSGAALDAGLIVNAANDATIRIAPPLTIGDAELDEFEARFSRALDAVAAAATH
jgi:acetylornithine/N-succinyldiaminopimelate aminotransferase